MVLIFRCIFLLKNTIILKPEVWCWGEFPIKDPITDQLCAHLYYYQQKLCAIDTFNEKLLGKNLKHGSAHILNCKHRLRIFFSYVLIENWYLIGNSPQYHNRTSSRVSQYVSQFTENGKNYCWCGTFGRILLLSKAPEEFFPENGIS